MKTFFKFPRKQKSFYKEAFSEEERSTKVESILSCGKFVPVIVEGSPIC